LRSLLKSIPLESAVYSDMSRFTEMAHRVLRHPGFLGLLATNFALGLAYSFVVPFMSMWGTLAVGMTPLMFGMFMTITSVSAIVLSTTLAALSDSHVARRSMLILGATGGLLGYTGYAFVRDPLMLTIIGALALGVASVNFSQLYAHVREELARPENSHTDSPLLMSLLRVSFSLAWTVGPAIGAAVMMHFSYRGIFLGAASLFLLFLIGVLRFVPHRPHPPVAHQKPREPLRAVLRRPVILAHFTGFVLVFAAFTMNMMNLPLLVTQQLGGSERDVGIIFGIAPVVEMPLMIWFGRLAARGHQVRLIRFGVFIAACYFLALTFVGAPWHIYPMQILSAASIAVTTNVAITFFQDLVPGQTGVATSIYSNSYSAGNLLGYFGFGVLLNSVGHRGVFWACTALSVVTLVIFMAYRHRHELAPPVGSET
jgi:MFS transporter, SET family, sugar efflux transporter